MRPWEQEQYRGKPIEWLRGYAGFWEDAELTMSEKQWRERTEDYKAGMSQAGVDFQQILDADQW